MILYHGSNLEVKDPRILKSNRYLDFGEGFYTTTNYDQAINFAKKVVTRNGGGLPTVNVYELNENNLDGIDILRFESADEKWLDFVSNNRNGILQKKKYDIIIGPVADDDVYRTLQLYLSKTLTKKQTLEALKIKELFNQYVFASTKSLERVKFLRKEVFEDGR